MTFRELLAEGRRRLEAAGIEEAENDARLLLLDTYRIDWCSLVWCRGASAMRRKREERIFR